MSARDHVATFNKNQISVAVLFHNSADILRDSHDISSGS
jgi:hypothetical protein